MKRTTAMTPITMKVMEMMKKKHPCKRHSEQQCWKNQRGLPKATCKHT